MTSFCLITFRASINVKQLHDCFDFSVQEIHDRVKKVEKLLEFLAMRTKPKLLTLCGILQMTNQTYLSLYLREKRK